MLSFVTKQSPQVEQKSQERSNCNFAEVQRLNSTLNPVLDWLAIPSDTWMSSQSRSVWQGGSGTGSYRLLKVSPPMLAQGGWQVSRSEPIAVPHAMSNILEENAECSHKECCLARLNVLYGRHWFRFACSEFAGHGAPVQSMSPRGSFVTAR